MHPGLRRLGGLLGQYRYWRYWQSLTPSLRSITDHKINAARQFAGETGVEE